MSISDTWVPACAPWPALCAKNALRTFLFFVPKNRNQSYVCTSEQGQLSAYTRTFVQTVHMVDFCTPLWANSTCEVASDWASSALDTASRDHQGYLQISVSIRLGAVEVDMQILSVCARTPAHTPHTCTDPHSTVTRVPRLLKMFVWHTRSHPIAGFTTNTSYTHTIQHNAPQRFYETWIFCEIEENRCQTKE